MTDDRLKEIEALVEAATPGPWEIDGESFPSCGDPAEEVFGPTEIKGPQGTTITTINDWCDAWRINHDVRLMAESRTIIPELLAEVRRLREQAIKEES